MRDGAVSLDRLRFHMHALKLSLCRLEFRFYLFSQFVVGEYLQTDIGDDARAFDESLVSLLSGGRRGEFPRV